jgi:hypothetical protein
MPGPPPGRWDQRGGWFFRRSTAAAGRATVAAISTYEATAACLGVRLLPGGRWRVFAPYGLSDLFGLVLRPNPALAPRQVYEAKVARWTRQWPELTVLPWP